MSGGSAKPDAFDPCVPIPGSNGSAINQVGITTSSLSFVFTRSGEIVVFPDKARMKAIVPREGEIMLALPNSVAIKRTSGHRVVHGLSRERRLRNASLPSPRTYVSRIVEIPPIKARSGDGDRRADRRDREADHRVA